MKRVLIVLILLLITNLITFGYSYYRFQRQEQELQSSLAESQQTIETLRQELAEAEKEADKLRVWRNFIQVQRQLTEINEDLNRLNFGDAIQRLENLKESIRTGKLGDRFQDYRESLVQDLEHSIEKLKQKQEKEARRSLFEFSRKMFEILSGISPLGPEQETEPQPNRVPEEQPDSETQSDTVA